MATFVRYVSLLIIYPHSTNNGGTIFAQYCKRHSSSIYSIYEVISNLVQILKVVCLFIGKALCLKTMLQ
ncbi:hypothetical protein IC582_016032 [Cucumis melo]